MTGSDDGFRMVDAHHHFWDLGMKRHSWLIDEPMIPFRYGDYSAIRRNFLPDDYRALAAAHNVVKTVLMEGEWDRTDPIGETRWVHAIAERFGMPDALVAQAWLDADDAADVLAAQAAFPLVRSVRHKPRAAANPGAVERGAAGSMGDSKWRRGYAMLADLGLMFDLQTPWWHLAEAAELAADFPETTIVLNHTGLPSDRSAEGLAGWRRGMQAFAARPNATVKISGIGLKGRLWSADDNREIVLDTISIFGFERCMFASNFPVDGVTGSFDAIIGGYRAITAHLPEAQRRALFHDNAVRIYRLDA